MTNGIPVCIECGGPVNALNEDEHGAPCPACAERLLETLPGVFHAPWGQEDEAAAAASVAEEDAVQEPAGGPSDPVPSGPRPGRTAYRGDSFGEPRGSA